MRNPAGRILRLSAGRAARSARAAVRSATHIMSGWGIPTAATLVGTNSKLPTATPFEGTHLPLRTWITALYLVSASSKGISSVKLGVHLGVGQKTGDLLLLLTLSAKVCGSS